MKFRVNLDRKFDSNLHSSVSVNGEFLEPLGNHVEENTLIAKTARVLIDHLSYRANLK